MQFIKSVLKLFIIFAPFAMLAVLATTDPPARAAPVDVLVNGAMIDADANGIPDGWSGIELGAADRVLCGTNRCKFQFDGAPAQRTLFQTIPYVTPPGTRLKFTVDVSFKNVGYGSYIQLFGTRNGSLTTIYHMDIPLGKQKRSMVISGVAGMDGIDHLTALITVTAGRVKLSAAHLEIDP